MDKKEIEKAQELKRKLFNTKLIANENSGDTFSMQEVMRYINGIEDLLALSQPKEVDLDELREEFKKEFMDDNTLIVPMDAFDFFLPHLQKPVESDAVEFTEWVNENYNRSVTIKKCVLYTSKKEKAAITNHYLITELYLKFKNNK